MQIAVDIRQLEISSQNISDISEALKRQGTNIDSVRRELLRQSEFERQAHELRKISSNLDEIRSRLRTFAEAMDAIAAAYSQTEFSIENKF